MGFDFRKTHQPKSRGSFIKSFIHLCNKNYIIWRMKQVKTIILHCNEFCDGDRQECHGNMAESDFLLTGKGSQFSVPSSARWR